LNAVSLCNRYLESNKIDIRSGSFPEISGGSSRCSEIAPDLHHDESSKSKQRKRVSDESLKYGLDPFLQRPSRMKEALRSRSPPLLKWSSVGQYQS